MKNLALILLAATVVSLLVHAQATNNGTFILLNAGAPSSCAWPTGATVTNGMAICGTTSGLYYSLNGSSTFNPVAAAAGGVTSFNGRTGAVVSNAITCTQASLSTGSSGTFTGTSCTD
jgi:hypothetical protein